MLKQKTLPYLRDKKKNLLFIFIEFTHVTCVSDTCESNIINKEFITFISDLKIKYYFIITTK